jgi:hypothetical protein
MGRRSADPVEAQLVSTSLPGRMGASLLGDWQQARPAQRFGYLAGGALILVGLAHLAGWLAVGGAWVGPVSFRKPTTFGISFGLTTITMAWITGHLRIADRTRWLLLGPLAAADTYEVAWVSTSAGAGSPPTSTRTPPPTTRCSWGAPPPSPSPPPSSWS